MSDNLRRCTRLKIHFAAKVIKFSPFFLSALFLSFTALVKVCSPNNDESLLAAGCESGLIVTHYI